MWGMGERGKSAHAAPLRSVLLNSHKFKLHTPRLATAQAQRLLLPAAVCHAAVLARPLQWLGGAKMLVRKVMQASRVPVPGVRKVQPCTWQRGGRGF